MKKILKAITVILPWYFRRKALIWWFGYEIDVTAKIGLSWIFPQKLIMKAGAKIDHFTVAIHLDFISMDEKSGIGRNNWITGFPSGTNSKHFSHQPDRGSRLIMGKHAMITKNHHIDCTNRIEIGNFSTIAGYYSQLMTHSLDVYENKQDSAPIKIGDYCFIGTNCIILGGIEFPSHSVLGAKSLLNKTFTEEWTLYAGVPAKPINAIDKNAKYFHRENGFVI